jgi:hypothetical protein
VHVGARDALEITEPGEVGGLVDGDDHGRLDWRATKTVKSCGR